MSNYFQEAERLGHGSVWTSEAYGFDAVSTADWLLPKTIKIKGGNELALVNSSACIRDRPRARKDAGKRGQMHAMLLTGLLYMHWRSGQTREWAGS